MHDPIANTGAEGKSDGPLEAGILRLLLLEDSELDAELTLAHLADGGFQYEAIRVDTRAEFLRELESRPDLILADYSLPMFDGMSALELARRHCPEVPFIFVSGALGEELAIDTLKRGATDYVLKDRLERLLPAVLRALRERDAHRERERLEKALRTSEERYRSLVQAISQVVWTTNAEGQVTEDMPGWREVTGRPREAILGMNWVDDLHPEDRERVRETWTTAYRTRTPYVCDYRIRTRDGTYRYFAARGVPVLEEDGTVREWVGLCTDITERKRYEEQLRHQAEALTAADEEKNRFLAMLGHELRNPLAPILAAMRILQENCAPDVVHRQREIIERQIRHMVRLVDDLLDVARITRGKIELRTENVDLCLLVEQAVQMAVPLLESRGHRLHVDGLDGPVRLHADPARITQVIGNLLNNAAKYTPPGGQIYLTVEQRKRNALISVRDTGRGIPPDRLRDIFQLFTQLDAPSGADQQGLGLGLTLAKNLVELHGGSIHAHSEGRGCGSEFVVRLPIAPASASTSDENDRESPVPTVQATGKQILVVDDNVDAAETLSELLELWGHRVVVAHDGVSALAETQTRKPEFVILDIGLPGMDGYEVARRLRSDPELQSVPLVALTGFGAPQDREEAERAGFDYHLTKPVDPDEIRALLMV